LSILETLLSFRWKDTISWFKSTIAFSSITVATRNLELKPIFKLTPQSGRFTRRLAREKRAATTLYHANVKRKFYTKSVMWYFIIIYFL